MSIDYILHFLLLIGLGGIGAFIAVRLKMPTAVFIGPIIFVGAYQVVFGSIIDKPYWLRLVVQILVGIVLGSKVTKAFVLDFKKHLKPTLMVSFIIFSSAIFLSIVLEAFTDWDLVTCILATAPGGQADMAILSDSVGAQTEKVIIIQFIRSQLALVVMLPLARLYFKRQKERSD